MSDQFSTPDYSEELTSDDKLWAMLAYIVPVIAALTFLMEDKKDREFIRKHSAQALVVWILNILIGGALSLTVILSCVPVLVWFVCIYWGVQAYNGKEVNIPVITDFVKNQGWA